MAGDFQQPTRSAGIKTVPASPENHLGEAGALPNLIVIGAQKSGTTALYRYLALHPEIGMSAKKELNFFVARCAWKRGTEWYARQFDADAKVRGEASPAYTATPRHRGVARRMHAVIPDAKLIYLVRDPIDRIRSQWLHNYSRRNTHAPLTEVATKPGNLARSMYYRQLKQYLRFFDRQQILVLDQWQLQHERRAALGRVFGFLDVAADYWHDDFMVDGHNNARLERRSRITALGRSHLPGLPSWLYKTPLTAPKPFEHTTVDPVLRHQLAELLREDIERFRDVTGQRFEHWSL